MLPSFLAQQPEKILFFADPGHGWLRVARSELVKHQIESKVSAYSYQSCDGRFVYLEEDCDLAAYLNALELDQESFRAWFKDVPRIYDDDEILRNSDSLECYRPA